MVLCSISMLRTDRQLREQQPAGYGCLQKGAEARDAVSAGIIYLCRGLTIILQVLCLDRPEPYQVKPDVSILFLELRV